MIYRLLGYNNCVLDLEGFSAYTAKAAVNMIIVFQAVQMCEVNASVYGQDVHSIAFCGVWSAGLWLQLRTDMVHT